MTATIQDRWVAPSAEALAAVPNHSRQPRDPTHELFGNPPKFIGQILSADSTLKQGKDGWSAPARFAFVASIALAVLFLIYLAARQVGPGTNITVWLIGGMFGLLIVFVAIGKTGFTAQSNYVGSERLYSVSVAGNRQNPLKEQSLQFADATELHVAQTRHYKNGAYQGTECSYAWNNADRKTLFAFRGWHHGGDKLPEPGHPYHFALAGEIAWSVYYLPVVERQLRQEGAVIFPIDSRRSVRVAPGFMEFHFGDEPQRINIEDIARFSLHGGEFSFKHKDARWYNREGKYKFPYASMANAKVFLLACDRLLGCQFS
ncbi:MAG TPA: hypothetical protein VGI81_13220 [Tepidisphaeraceae bacterium]